MWIFILVKTSEGEKGTNFIGLKQHLEPGLKSTEVRGRPSADLIFTGSSTEQKVSFKSLKINNTPILEWFPQRQIGRRALQGVGNKICRKQTECVLQCESQNRNSAPNLSTGIQKV